MSNFSTKAGTLLNTKDKLTTAKIPEIFTFKYEEWALNDSLILKEINESFLFDEYIVRSSCKNEDLKDASNAGAYLSELHIKASGLRSSINNVFNSYESPQNNDEVLIQPMLQNVLRSGVLFSHDPNTCSPYRVINWSEGKDTSQITGGGNGQTWQQAAKLPKTQERSPKFIKKLIKLCEELLDLFEQQPIDIEFAFTNYPDNPEKENLWLLQVRPLILREKPEANEAQVKRLQIVEEQVQRGFKKHPYLMGKKTVFGVMPDWNPAEIVGIRPKPLALSLYREMVTDSIWAYQRHNYGYRNLRSFPLMPNFFGIPYIDVRLSFNSFIPADLDSNLANRLVDYYVDRLLEEPELHDKVEFEIVHSCYTLDIKQRLSCLEERGFTKNECESITTSLKNLTNKIIHPKTGLWKIDMDKINILNKRRQELMESNVDQAEKIYWLLEDGKRYGTLPFAGLARAGFIAVQMLKSFTEIGIFSEKDYNSFIKSLTTVSGQLSDDRATMDKTSFLRKYGHLRPGTYDITSKRYDEAPDYYFDWHSKTQKHHQPQEFSMTIQQMRNISQELESHGLYTDPVGLFDFLQAGIEQREEAKFHFTKNLSEALSLICSIGERYDISREDLAFCDIKLFKELHISASNQKEMLQKSIESGKQRFEETCKLTLPPLISSTKDIWSFEWPNTIPNFITQNEVTAPVISCEGKNNLKGSIICIPNADPGYDWLFAYPIAGLITAWGGANSHMAIRAGELDLPAIIGCGEKLYKKYSSSKRLFIDCANKVIRVIE